MEPMRRGLKPCYTTGLRSMRRLRLRTLSDGILEMGTGNRRKPAEFYPPQPACFPWLADVFRFSFRNTWFPFCC